MNRAADTIVAASSPPGRSPRALVRISGDRAKPIAVALTNQPLDNPRTVTPCRLRLSTTSHPLPALFVFTPAPHTYTTADMVELQCPGHPALLERLIGRTIELGARLAEPGEFTCRAFLAGKLDLTQAEGVAATIAATSDSQMQAARLLRQGRLGRFAADVVDQLAQQLALVEAGIDFVDQDDVVPVTPGQLDAALGATACRLDDLLSRSRSWGAIEALPRFVLAGAPSTGKSTLFNALLGRHRAVVSPMPGTTRDILTEPLMLADDRGRHMEVMLIDMAGLDQPAAALDRQIQAAGADAIARADVILHVSDDQPVANPPDWPDVATISVRTKADVDAPADSGFDVAVSAVTGQAMGDLRRIMAQRIGARGVSVSAQMLALQPRHQSALRHACDHLAAARHLVTPQIDRPQLQNIELIAAALRSALDELSGLGGHMTPDDIIGRVFATFCIGK